MRTELWVLGRMTDPRLPLPQMEQRGRKGSGERRGGSWGVANDGLDHLLCRERREALTREVNLSRVDSTIGM